MIADPALIVVDMQNDFTKPEYALDEVHRGHMQEALDATGSFLDRYRESGRTPILIRTIHDENVDSPNWVSDYEGSDDDTLCERGTPGAEFASELNVQDSDVIVTKHRYDAFYNTPLNTYLLANDISELLVCGVGTPICVESTVRSGYIRDYSVTTLRDCCSTSQQEYEDTSLLRISRFFGDVRDSTEIELEPIDRAPHPNH